MRIAYLDLSAGVSGDMFLGALIDAGLDYGAWRAEMAELGIPGLEVKVFPVKRAGLRGTKVNVEAGEPQPVRRHLRDLEQIISRSSLPAQVKERSRQVFQNLARAEARVHGITLEEVHFHEAGAWDALVDVVGTVLGLTMLEIEHVYASPLDLGGGSVVCEHGLLPVPVPAVLELVKGIPCYSKGIQAELVTPTGAALVTTLAESFGPLPKMTVATTGYGAGSRELAIPNLLRLIIGHDQAERTPINKLPALLLEANIDDMQPEFYGYLQKLLFARGAQDVFTTPISMKKNRPAVKLSVLTAPEELEKLAGLILRETTSLGLRVYPVTKYTLEKKSVEVNTVWGPARVKLGLMGKTPVNLLPEYDDCAKIAWEHGLPLKEVYQTVLELARASLKGNDEI